jgi:predicted nucleic acid-binding OB-fold protein
MQALVLGEFQVDNIKGTWFLDKFLRLGLLKENYTVGTIIDLKDHKYNLSKSENLKNTEFILQKRIDLILMFFEKEIITFLNKSKSLTLKLHQLDLLPNIGDLKKKSIIRERSIKNFQNYLDFEIRTNTKIKNIFSKLIISEITDNLNVFKFIL